MKATRGPMLATIPHATYRARGCGQPRRIHAPRKGLAAPREWVAKQIHVQTQSPDLACDRFELPSRAHLGAEKSALWHVRTSHQIKTNHRECPLSKASVLLEFEQLDDDAVWVPDIACQATVNRTGLHTGNSPLARRARPQEFAPGPGDVVDFEADMRRAGHSGLRRGTIACTPQVLESNSM